MTRKRLLVDFENVQNIDLARLDGSFQIDIFVGASQKSVPMDLVEKAQKLGDRVLWHRVDASGKNALDFFISCELGRIAVQGGEVECIVLSRDKGFDPLLRHLNRNGVKCRRVNSMMELEPKAAQAPDSSFTRVIEILGKMEKKSRPRKRKTLSQHIASLCQNKLAPSEVERIVDTLFAKNLVSETNNVLTYEF